MIHKILCTYRRDSILFLFDDSIYIYFFVLAVIVKSNFSNLMLVKCLICLLFPYFHWLIEVPTYLRMKTVLRDTFSLFFVDFSFCASSTKRKKIDISLAFNLKILSSLCQVYILSCLLKLKWDLRGISP